jgi:signal transduction histidine kinase/CheY-like chemotaxis protein
MDHYSSVVITKEEGLPDLRDKLFISVLLITFPICLLVYIPSIIVSIKTNQFIIGLFDTIAMLVLVLIFFIKYLSIKNKKLLFNATFYILSIVLSIYLGIKGPSFTILICTSVMITLFQSKRAGLISIALNAIIFLFIMAIVPIKSTSLTFFQEYTLVEWIGVGVNLIAFNTLLVFSVASLVNRLNESFLKEKNLLASLKRESLHLMIAKQKAEESDRLKSAFLHNISHEIRTPLNAIIGFSALLTVPDNSLEEQTMYIESILKGSDQLLSIVNDIIDISSIEAKSANNQLSKVNLNSRIEKLCNQFMPVAAEKNISLIFKTAFSSERTEILTDQSKFDRILSNLISNAIKFTLKGQIILGYELKDSEIEFFVSDTGIGIPSELHSKIFENFYQVEQSFDRLFEGTGLGLSICKALVGHLGGKIWLHSESGSGSTFYFTLPFVQPVPITDARTRAPESEKTSLPRQITALVAEDDDINFSLIKSMLKTQNIKVIHAVNGIEAVEICRSQKNIDLIIMDIRMPGIDGYTASRQIREFRPDVVIIVQTAYYEDKEAALKSGCNDFISKPFSKEQFISKIRENIDLS